MNRTQSKRKPLELEGRLGLSQREAARVIGKSEAWLRALARRGLGPRVVRMAGARAVIYPLAELRRWLEANAADPRDAA